MQSCKRLKLECLWRKSLPDFCGYFNEFCIMRNHLLKSNYIGKYRIQNLRYDLHIAQTLTFKLNVDTSIRGGTWAISLTRETSSNISKR